MLFINGDYKREVKSDRFLAMHDPLVEELTLSYPPEVLDFVADCTELDAKVDALNFYFDPIAIVSDADKRLRCFFGRLNLRALTQVVELGLFLHYDQVVDVALLAANLALATGQDLDTTWPQRMGYRRRLSWEDFFRVVDALPEVIGKRLMHKGLIYYMIDWKPVPFAFLHRLGSLQSVLKVALMHSVPSAVDWLFTQGCVWTDELVQLMMDAMHPVHGEPELEIWNKHMPGIPDELIFSPLSSRILMIDHLRLREAILAHPRAAAKVYPELLNYLMSYKQWGTLHKMLELPGASGWMLTDKFKSCSAMVFGWASKLNVERAWDLLYTDEFDEFPLPVDMKRAARGRIGDYKQRWLYEHGLGNPGLKGVHDAVHCGYFDKYLEKEGFRHVMDLIGDCLKINCECDLESGCQIIHDHAHEEARSSLYLALLEHKETRYEHMRYTIGYLLRYEVLEKFLDRFLPELREDEPQDFRDILDSVEFLTRRHCKRK